MSKLKWMILLLPIIFFAVGLLQTHAEDETNLEPKNDTRQPTKSISDPDISVPDKGVTIGLRLLTSEKAQLVKHTKDKNGKINSQEIQGFEAVVPENTVVRFIVDSEEKIAVHDVTIIVGDNGTQTREQFKDLAKFQCLDRLLKNRIQYVCTFGKKEDAAKNILTRVVTVVVPMPVLSGIKVTVGPFLSNLPDENYLKIDNKIVVGNQDKLSNTLGVLVHLPLYSCNSWKFRWALALSTGLSLDKYSISNEGLSITRVPPTLGGSLLLAGSKNESLITITGGGILKTVKQLDGYSAGQAWPSGIDSSTKPTRDVNRYGWFVAITFSYDIFDQLGIKINQK